MTYHRPGITGAFEDMDRKLNTEHQLLRRAKSLSESIFQKQNTLEIQIEQSVKRLRLVQQSRRDGHGEEIKRIREASAN